MAGLWRKWNERVLIAALIAACLLLAFLQYRWTGELSRAESQRLFAGVRGRLQQFTRAFDGELRQSVLSLVPSGEEVRSLGPRRANEERLRNAAPNLDRPLFRRVAAAVPDQSGTLTFLEADLAAQRFATGLWPDSRDWHALRMRLQGVAHGDSPRGGIVTPDSALIEVPVFQGDTEAEWLLFELDLDHAAKTWLPELTRTYLNPEADEHFQIEILSSGTPPRRVYGKAAAPAQSMPDLEATLFPLHFLGRRGRAEPGRWLVRVTHPAGSVPAAVALARWRNLAIASLPLLLIAAAGAALVRHTRQARRLAEAQYQFFAGVSHELRTPLTVIQGAGHNLLSGVVKDESQRESYLRAIVKQSAALSEMVDQILSYGVARNARLPAETSVTLLDVAVSEAIESAALELEQTNRSVDVDMPPELPPVRGEQLMLRRLLGNLILNAIRHGGGEVRVSAAVVGAMVEVRVADSGAGIPASELKQVFDPFFRGEQARAGRTRGTGLGLSLVKETAERLGGSVSVESQAGKGTVFCLRLPVAAPSS